MGSLPGLRFSYVTKSGTNTFHGKRRVLVETVAS